MLLITCYLAEVSSSQKLAETVSLLSAQVKTMLELQGTILVEMRAMVEEHKSLSRELIALRAGLQQVREEVETACPKFI